MAKPQIEPLISSLESTLQRSYQLHESLLELMIRKRKALAAGQSDAMIELCRLENEQVQQISELEKNRLEMVARLTQLIDPDAAQPLHMRDLAMRFPEPLRGRVLLQRQRLREKILQVKEQCSIAKCATEALMKHVQGLVQTIGTFAAVGASYSDRGGAPINATAVGTINLVA